MTESLATALRCIVDPDATIRGILSETGLKTEAGPPGREAVAFDEASLRRLVGDRLGGRS